MDAFDSDVVIYAAIVGHPLGRRIRDLILQDADGSSRAIGSVLLLPEVMAKPIRENESVALTELGLLLARVHLLPVDHATAELATTLAATYRLKAADAIHLATAVMAGADRFITNNARDFPKTIAEIDVTYPLDLPDPGAT